MKAIIFDGDGVLINAEMFSIKYQKEFGIDKDIMLPFYTGIFKECIIGKADLKKEIQPYLKLWGWEKSVDDFLLYWFESENVVNKNLINDIKELKRKGYICLFATNQEKYRTDYIKNEMGFGEVFDKIFSSSKIGCRKKDPKYFEYILEKTGLKPEYVLLVDDERENIESAESIGIKGYHFKGYEVFKNEVLKRLP